MVAALAACGGGSSGSEPLPAGPTIQLLPDGDAWASEPTSDSLTRVSNNGFGYTGEIDRYVLEMPATGRLQISLSWNHSANFDLILAEDETGRERIAEGLEDASEPEYIGADVTEGQKLFLFVAGWTGDPGPYLLETVLLPPAAPLFALATAPDFTEPWPADKPMTFTFTVDLEPGQDLTDKVYVVHPGAVSEGTWCIEGPDATFYPHLPEKAGDQKGLLPSSPHVLQFRRAAKGIRAATGEYLSEVIGIGFSAGPHADLWPAQPLVTGVTPAPGAPYRGEAITVAISEPLDPATVAPELLSVFPGGATQPLAFDFDLHQQWHCSGNVEVRLLIAPRVAPPAGTTTRLRLPGTIQPLGGGVVFLPVTMDFPPP